jgi:2-polyprenyl-3-methyl-5-hydroxy-6-metoxy-1,4-benzoquinol methylase
VKTLDDIRTDFDEIAREAGPDASGTGCYDPFLLSLVPDDATQVLDIGCGIGRLTWALATDRREVVGIDLSPQMLLRARTAGTSTRASFMCGDFLTVDFTGRRFDCIVSVAAMHHMDHEGALARIAGLLRPGGRAIIHDLRRTTGVVDRLHAYGVLAFRAVESIGRTGRAFPPRRVRRLWARHGAGETYLSCAEARALVDRCLPGATVLSHALWRYTIVWDKPSAV